MFIEVQFKNKQLVFGGKTYDYEVVGEVPKKGSIIRMLNEDRSKAVANGTRVKVVNVKPTSTSSIQKVSCVKSSLDEPSLSSKKIF
jgi:hypothetical protein